MTELPHVTLSKLASPLTDSIGWFCTDIRSSLFRTDIYDSGSLSVQHAAQRRPAGQHGAQQVGVKQTHHVIRFGPQQQSVSDHGQHSYSNEEIALIDTSLHDTQSWQRIEHTPVDACWVHKISDVSTVLLDGLEGFLHLLLLGDVTAESQVVCWREKHTGLETDWHLDSCWHGESC